ncbi:hypothetical protein [Janthinobacterium sp.]|uniref:hypothetical protein n=1 Tax=Janthinobacterium sp. TaxID=1871054 RepID=UPI00261DA641|nr:hypothetical protein [Janthinobacterium sp.]
MQHDKFDGALAAALRTHEKTGAPPLAVFLEIEPPLNDKQKQQLQQWGIHAEEGDTTLTAYVTHTAITALSALPWVSRISLSQVSRAMPRPRMP